MHERDQEDRPVQRRRTGLIAGLLATGALGAVALAGAAVADDGQRSSAGATGTAPSFVQDSQRPDGDGRDCPERDGSGDGGGSRQAPAPSPDTGGDVAL